MELSSVRLARDSGIDQNRSGLSQSNRQPAKVVNERGRILQHRRQICALPMILKP